MWWKHKPKPLVVPPFGAIEKPIYPVIFEAYGIVPITPNLSHRLTIGRVVSATGRAGAIPSSRVLSSKILAEKGVREDDKRLWAKLLNGYPTHYLRFSYRRSIKPVAPATEILHVWLNLSVTGYDKDAVARSIGNFLTFIALEQTPPADLLLSTKIYNAENWLHFAYARYRRFWVESGLIQERETMPDVKGYRLTGDR